MRASHAAAVLVAGAGGVHLAGSVARALGLAEPACAVRRFPDGEAAAEVTGEVAGADVYLVQGTHPPSDGHLVELLLLADACRREGAARLTALVPYVGYARQDRRTRPGVPVAAAVVGRVLAGAVDRLVVVDPHSSAVEVSTPLPVHRLSAVDLLADAVAALVEPTSAALPPVVVAPDLGAAGLAQRYAARLACPMAQIRKRRITGAEVAADAVVGEVAGRRPVVVDDMITTGGTIAAAVDALRAAGAVAAPVLVTTHAVLVEPAAARLTATGATTLVTTDSVPPPASFPLDVRVVSLAPLIAEAVRRLASGGGLGDLAAFA